MSPTPQTHPAQEELPGPAKSRTRTGERRGVADRILEIEEHLRIMEEYLDVRRAQRDWHGVQDAASDIRELEAQLRVLRETRSVVTG